MTYQDIRETTMAPWPSSLARLGPERLLVLLASASALGFGLLLYLLQVQGDGVGRGAGGLSGVPAATFAFVVALVFGFFLLLAHLVMGEKPTEGSVLALAFSLVLLFFGGTAGVIAGILGLVGGVVAIARHAGLFP